MKLKPMLNIIVPLAGKIIDNYNSTAINNYPIPLIDIKGKSLIEYVIENIAQIDNEIKFIFILNEEDCNKYHLDNTLKLLTNDPKIIKIKGQTMGAICSILMAIDEIDKDEELIILNSDQIIDIDYNKVLNDFRSKKSDAGLIIFKSVHPRWSFARIINGKVVQTAEKNPISNNAIAGFYYFKKANDFINGAFDVIRYDEKYENNYYTSSVYNQLILEDKFITAYEIPSNMYYSFYSSQKLKEFEDYLKQEL